jgi:DNA-binding CsgD family transcriptional regulator
MKVLGDSDLIEDEARQRSEFYAFARRWDVSFCCLSRIDQIDDLAVVVAVHRTEAAGHVETAERMAFGALLPHFQSAVRLQLRLEDQTALAGVGMMDAVGLAVVLCDRSGQVQAVSAAAEVVLSVGAAATVRGGRLYGTNDKSNAALQSAIARAAASQKDVSGPRASRIYLRGHKDDGPSAADVTPVPRTMNGFNLGSAVLVVLEPRRLEAGNRTHEVRKLYGLTKTEADVAIALASGSSVADISEQRGVRISTLRSQVACILAKTRTSRQAELVALLSRPAKQTSG